MIEIFAKPAVGAIIYKIEQGQRYILMQTRNKENGGSENGMIEIPAGKVRDYKDPKNFYPMHINALEKYFYENL